MGAVRAAEVTDTGVQKPGFPTNKASFGESIFYTGSAKGAPSVLATRFAGVDIPPAGLKLPRSEYCRGAG